MSDEVRDLFRRGAETPRPGWGFEDVWQRARRRRVRDISLKVGATLTIVAVMAVSVPLIGSQRVDRDSDIAPVGKAKWERIPVAPIEGRLNHVAVWTGEEMLIWGGGPSDSDDTAGLVDGAAFDPAMREWRAISAAPLESSGGRTALWTGSEMLVWGGEFGDGSHGRPDDGAAYDPRTDTWTELPSSPRWSLAGHSAVWTGETMIVWGGVDMESHGAVFDPRSRSWQPIAPAPIDGRFGHAAVWTGTEMIVWGGSGSIGGPMASGASYDPDLDSWRELPAAPLAERRSPSAVWTGEEMVIWGGWDREGALRDGAAYDPASDTWRDIPRAPVRADISSATTAWTGSEMVVVGHLGELAAYSPGTDEWTRLPAPPSGAVLSPTLVQAHGELILWGGAPFGEGGATRGGGILHVGR